MERSDDLGFDDPGDGRSGVRICIENIVQFFARRASRNSSRAIESRRANGKETNVEFAAITENNEFFILRLSRSAFQISTDARTVEVAVYGVSMPIYTSSFLKIKLVPKGFASSTSPDAVKTEAASGGDVLPGSVGTILGETLFSEKTVYFEHGNDDAEPGEADYGHIGFVRGKNCFASTNHESVKILASGAKVAIAEELGPVRMVAATCEANAIKKSGRTGILVPVHAASARVTDRKVKDNSSIAKA
ncbi:hypothetical protein BGZ79_010528 [Entomortierella chlamydospora]|nr:hypothetical protein BGZ79_010528 [Entomortierella chlamydospora]